MTTLVKICGLKHMDHALLALDHGADYLGFIHFEKSPRHLSLEAMAELFSSLRAQRPKARLVSVVVNPDEPCLETLALIVKPDLIQLHGQESLERVRDIRSRFDLGLIKAFGVKSPLDVTDALLYEPLVDHLLFDAPAPHAEALPGGLGHSFDWRHLKGLQAQKPWFLAGGLRPETAQEALRATNAPGLDVSSGVEASAGLKDPALIRAFLSSAKGSGS